jgi:precorrin-6B C5,15-methyltransferase / cobalt-precorrin-6B C5,C15-methyltransferase
VTPWLSVVGIGEDGLDGISGAARALVMTAELLVGGRRHLAMMPENLAAERLAWDSPLAATLPKLAAWRGRRVVVLATGDPLCYGVGAMLLRSFDPAELTFLPQPSAFSLAAARLAWPLETCRILSLHGRPLDALRLHLAPGARLLILAENGETPARIAALLCEEGWEESRITVLEHMGGKAGRMLSAPAGSWQEARCADLNTVAVECRAGTKARILSHVPGLPDAAFLHDGQLTKREIRAATLAVLAPLPEQRLWDIGAGCGSIAIEWLRAAERASAIAIERSPERCALIARNAARLGVPRLEIVQGEVPQALAGLAPPDAIFIGGGLDGPDLLDRLWKILPPGGRLVANAVTLESEAVLLTWQAHNATAQERGVELTRFAISRAEPIGRFLGWRSLMPITQLAMVKSR